MKKVLVFLCFSAGTMFFASQSFAQLVGTPIASGIHAERSFLANGLKGDKTRIFIDGLHTIRPNAGLPYKVSGKPYVAENWVSGRIEFTDKPPLQVEKLNYDALENMLLMLKEEVEYEFTDPIKSFVLTDGGKERIFWNMTDGVYEVLHSGELAYLKKNNKEMLVESKYGEQYGEGKIVDDNTYYVLDAKFNLVKINKPSAIFDVFETHMDNLKTFAKKEKLNLKLDSDVVKLFQHFESL